MGKGKNYWYGGGHLEDVTTLPPPSLKVLIVHLEAYRTRGSGVTDLNCKLSVLQKFILCKLVQLTSLSFSVSFLSVLAASCLLFPQLLEHICTDSAAHWYSWEDWSFSSPSWNNRLLTTSGSAGTKTSELVSPFALLLLLTLLSSISLYFCWWGTLGPQNKKKTGCENQWDC